VPIIGDSLGSTRDRIRGNFQQINTVFAINHIAFNQTGQGKHPFLQMPEQVTAPITLANEAGFYPKVGTNPAETNLWMRGENNGFEYQLTAADQTNVGVFGNNTAYAANQTGGWTFLPGGLIMQYGLITVAPNGGTATITFPKAYTSQVYSVVLTFNRTDPSSVVQTVRLSNFNAASLSSFNFYSGSNNNVPITWISIGK
jgi:hypothetical protein